MIKAILKELITMAKGLGKLEQQLPQPLNKQEKDKKQPKVRKRFSSNRSKGGRR